MLYRSDSFVGTIPSAFNNLERNIERHIDKRREHIEGNDLTRSPDTASIELARAFTVPPRPVGDVPSEHTRLDREARSPAAVGLHTSKGACLLSPSAGVAANRDRSGASGQEVNDTAIPTITRKMKQASEWRTMGPGEV